MSVDRQLGLSWSWLGWTRLASRTQVQVRLAPWVSPSTETASQPEHHLLMGSADAQEGKLYHMHFKSVPEMHLLTFHWPKRTTQPSPKSKDYYTTLPTMLIQEGFSWNNQTNVLTIQTGNPQKEIQIAKKQMKRCLISLLIKEMHMQREVCFPLPR